MSSHTRRERALAVALAALAGFVDAVAFIELGGYFVSFMTGNTVQFGAGIVENRSTALLPIVLIGLFVLGVICASLIGRFIGRWRAPVALLIVSSLLLGAAVAASAGQVWLAIAAMALAMGSENAVFEKDGEVQIGLTYMTGALVKMGEGIVTALVGGNRTAWLWHFSLWLGLACGALVGAFAFVAIGLEALWFAAGIGFVLMFAALLIVRRTAPAVPLAGSDPTG